MNTDEYENNIAEYEAARNESMDRYFAARPQLMRSVTQENLFEAGFERAWKIRTPLSITPKEVSE